MLHCNVTWIVLLVIVILPQFIQATDIEASTESISKLSLLKVQNKLSSALNRILNFVNLHYNEMNMDAALGIVLTQAQLLQAIQYSSNQEMTRNILMLLEKSEVYKRIVRILPRKSQKDILFIAFLLKPSSWIRDVWFINNTLSDLGIYESWTAEDLLKNKTATYKGNSSDECLLQILHEKSRNSGVTSCFLNKECQEFMLGNRNDTSYLLTHRLLFLQISQIIKCKVVTEESLLEMISNYCSLILRETKTNAYLNFPQHDIFLEQVVLCGMEGFTEFLDNNWVDKIIQWQTHEGCYGERPREDRKGLLRMRSANSIGFGCTDHATGLAAAALAVNLHYVLQKLRTT